MPHILVKIILLTALCHGWMFAAARAQLNLDGEWKFQLDPDNAGLAGQWAGRPENITARIQVPGCWQAQGFGEPIGVLRHHYEGAAWYAREVPVPETWRGKSIFLHVGAAFTYTSAFVNGLPAGTHEGFSTPFRFDITPLVRPGQSNLLVFRVVNVHNPLGKTRRVLTERDTSEVTGALNFAAPWGGITRSVKLEAVEPARIEQTTITTDIHNRIATFTVEVRNGSIEDLKPAGIEVRISPLGGGEPSHGTATVSIGAGTTASVVIRVPMPGAKLWSPESPNLYEATITLASASRPLDQTRERYGFREIRTQGANLLLNGKPLYVRGYGDDSAEVLTGAPPHDKAAYLKRMRIARQLGFNAVRFHSTTPVEECFEAADETGILVAAELPVIYQEYLLPHKELLRGELIRIMEANRNHPSWFFFTLGNEFGLQRFTEERAKQAFLETVREFAALAKQLCPQLLVSSNTGYLVPPMDLAVPYRGLSRRVPNIKHEYGAYYSTLPDPSRIPRYSGVFKPLWLEQETKWIDANFNSHAYSQYLDSSWRLYANGVKAYIERLRAMPEFTGYFYWLINDFPGGTPEGPEWNWGWLDQFFEPKSISPAQGQELNSAVLPLIDCPIESRTLWLEDGKTVNLLVSNYGGADIHTGTLNWEVVSQGQRLTAGRLPVHAVPMGAISTLGRIRIANLPLKQATELELVVTLTANGHDATNRWKFWAFPRAGLLQRVSAPVTEMIRSAALQRYFPFIKEAPGTCIEDGVLIASDFNPRVVDCLHRGGRVLLLAESGRFGGRFSYFPGSGGALGIRIPANAPALAGFPYNGFPDLQFFNLLEGAAAGSPAAGMTPILGGVRMVRAGQDRNALSAISFLSEARVGRGKLLFTTLNLRANFDDACPEAIYLFDRLLRYAASSEFNPAAEISAEQIDDIRVPYTEMIH
ncbi:MAG: hypothetical protein IT160_04245 [Bryobacterales bacterium]|nr:hypothetical protein [Bryobacterales bacterium]